jgi:hypothetical protein
VVQEYFSLDIEPIQLRCKAVSVPHLRLRINDFDPFNLRLRLPEVIKQLAAAHKTAGGTAYIHCTAGEAQFTPSCTVTLLSYALNRISADHSSFLFQVALVFVLDSFRLSLAGMRRALVVT